jgi:hypothetical protein
VAEENRTVSGFTSATFATEGSLTIEPGAQEALLVRAEDNLLPYLLSEVQGGTLVMRTENGVDLQPTRPIEFYLTVVDLDEFVFAGVGDVDLLNMTTAQLTLTSAGVGSIECSNLDAVGLDVTLAGVGDVTIAGQVDEQTIMIAGVGDYEAGDLASREATVTISSSSSATVRVSDRLVVTITGNGSVYYIGDPVVESTITGTGRVEKTG